MLTFNMKQLLQHHHHTDCILYKCSECKIIQAEDGKCQNCLKNFQQDVKTLVDFPIELSENNIKLFNNFFNNNYFSEDGSLYANIEKNLTFEIIIIYEFPKKSVVQEIVISDSQILNWISSISFTSDNNFCIYKRLYMKEMDLFIYNLNLNLGKSFYFKDALLKKIWMKKENELYLLIEKYQIMELYMIDKQFNIQLIKQTKDWIQIQQVVPFIEGFYLTYVSQMMLFSNLNLKKINSFHKLGILNIKSHLSNFLFIVIKHHTVKSKTLMNQIRNNKIIRIINNKEDNIILIKNYLLSLEKGYDKNILIFYDFTKGSINVQIILSACQWASISSLKGYLAYQIQGIYNGWPIKEQDIKTIL